MVQWALRQIQYKDVEQYDDDYCRRAKDPQVPENCHWYGVYRDDVMVSYFAVSDGVNDGLFIQRGYVLPQFRQPDTASNATAERGFVWKYSMKLLEQAAKQAGYRNIEFESTRNPWAYHRMFKSIGFKPRYIGFRKYI
jgi:hypothetical protein